MRGAPFTVADALELPSVEYATPTAATCCGGRLSADACHLCLLCHHPG
jgi:hypothetical protein